MSTLEPIFVQANLAEAALWGVIAVVVLFRRSIELRSAWAGLLVAFGVSDLVESTSGAWYDPWWLLLWKAACIFGFLTLGVRAWRRRDKVKSIRITSTKEPP
jgi:hypothetical protein